MSVLIKGMEMPKNCNKCLVTANGYCRIIGYPNGDAINKRYKPLWCPLVEVPTLHGRLIDADELKANIHMEGYRGYRARDDGAVTTFNYINDAPTIIEAEE